MVARDYDIELNVLRLEKSHKISYFLQMHIQGFDLTVVREKAQLAQIGIRWKSR